VKKRKEEDSAEASAADRTANHLGRKLAGAAAGLLLILLETVLLLMIALYGVMYVFAKGPSPTARNLFVMSVRETSAIGFLADLYLSPEEIAEITATQNTDEPIQSDTSLVQIAQNLPASDDGIPAADQWGLVDEDGDGIIVEQVKGEGYSGYMMVVLDPSRVIVGCKPESFHKRGYTVAEMVEEFDAAAGTNAGGFEDAGGTGNGSTPDSMVVYGGEIYGAGTRQGFAGFDSNHILHVGKLSKQDVIDQDIQYGVSFGPVLIANGEIVLPDSYATGLNPRTAIGQRSDGAVLLLVIDGRQAISLGATVWDLAEIFMEYGAVNACNLDGGSSSLMWYQGDYINNCASVIGIRPVPSTILVLKEGVSADEG